MGGDVDISDQKVLNRRAHGQKNRGVGACINDGLPSGQQVA